MSVVSRTPKTLGEGELEAIAVLKAAFARRPKPKTISGCLHCLEQYQRDILLASDRGFHARPSSDTDCLIEALGHFAWDAFSTVGDAESYTYFLPAMLAQAMRFPDSSLMDIPENFAGKLLQSGTLDIAEERAAIALWLRTIFESDLDRRDFLTAEYRLETAFRAGLEVDDLLTCVPETQAKEFARYLAKRRRVTRSLSSFHVALTGWIDTQCKA